MNSIILVWCVTAVMFLFVEIGSPGLFYFLSFFFGSLAAAFTALFSDNLFPQLLVFLVVSIIAFALLNWWIHKYSAQAQHYYSNIYALRGKEGVIIVPATLQSFGYVHVGGEIWACKTIYNQEIPAGSYVHILDIQGAHLIVTQRDK